MAVPLCCSAVQGESRVFLALGATRLIFSELATCCGGRMRRCTPARLAAIGQSVLCTVRYKYFYVRELVLLLRHFSAVARSDSGVETLRSPTLPRGARACEQYEARSKAPRPQS